MHVLCLGGVWGGCVGGVWGGWGVVVVVVVIASINQHTTHKKTGYEQQDAQELLACILDKLHEDLNRGK